jgi:hypothetical protein
MREMYSGATETSSAKATSACTMRFAAATMQGTHLKYQPASTEPCRG